MPFEYDGTSGHFDACVSHYMGKKNKMTGKNFSKNQASRYCATVMRKQESGKNATFADFAKPVEIFADDFEFIKSEDGNYYVNFYLTTDDIDAVNDMVTPECQEDILKQLQGKEINVKMGLEHDVYIANDKRLLPHAKIMKAEKVQENGKSKIKATAMMNKHHPEFKSVMGSIEDGFLDATSIEYKPVDFVNKNIGGRAIRLLNKILLKGVTFTGRPINEAAKILDFFVKSQKMYDIWEEMQTKSEPIENIKSTEVIPMTDTKEEAKAEVSKEEPKKEEMKAEAPKEEQKTEEMVTISKKEFDEMKAKIDDIELKAKHTDIKAEIKSAVMEAMKDYKPEVKSLVEQKEKFEGITTDVPLDTKSLIKKAFS